METLSLFDFLPDGEKYKPIKSTDWKWTMKDDYPKEKNGQKFKKTHYQAILDMVAKDRKVKK